MAVSAVTPGDIQMAGAQITFGGIDLGSTSGGVTFTPTVTVNKVFVDQISMPVRHFITQEECQVTANLSEQNLTLLQWADVGGTYTLDAGASAKKIEVGGDQIDNDNDYKELIITPLIDGSSTISTDANLKITVYLCIPFTHPEQAFTKDGVRFTPVVFEAKQDSSKTVKKQFYLLGDSTATA